ncbi:MAG: thermonuclease [Syntrophobacteraceae bacterium]|nr:thermonuclease [Syntrophobacteraceae bacterium]
MLYRASGARFCRNPAFMALSRVALALLLCPLFASAAATEPSSGIVADVFDGDTIMLSSGEKVRYLGIDAPEVSHRSSPADCFGHEAKTLNKSLVLHKRVRLLYDRVRTDGHGRLLAYVFVPDGRCVNAELVLQGCALVFHSADGFGRFEEFLTHQKVAMRARRGLWGQCSVKPSDHYLANCRSHVFHRPGCTYGQQTGPGNRVRFDSRATALEAGFSPCRRCKP